MNTITLSWMTALVLAVAIWPQESTQFALEVHARFMIKYLNLQILIRSWLMYRRLRKDFKKMGIDLPPFQFTPLQDR